MYYNLILPRCTTRWAISNTTSSTRTLATSIEMEQTQVESILRENCYVGFCPLNKSAWSLVPKKSQSYNNHTSQWIKWRLKDVNLRFPWGSRKRFKHCHGSWILRTAGSAQPRGGGHPWRGDQHQPSVCAGAEENCIPPIWIPYRQIPMGPLCWQSLQGEGPI